VISPATPLIETVDLGTLDDVRAVVADETLRDAITDAGGPRRRIGYL
jgi:hypothetical protein